MSRVIRKSKQNSNHEAADLLAGLFTAELVSPSKCVWLISPWISDVELIDNSAGTFASLARFGKRRVRLTEILIALAASGCHVVIGTTVDEHNKTFVDRLKQLAADSRVDQLIKVDVDPHQMLHTKAIVGDDYTLAGSMNITFNGISVREEYLDLQTDPKLVAQSRIDAFGRFGGVL